MSLSSAVLLPGDGFVDVCFVFASNDHCVPFGHVVDMAHLGGAVEFFVARIDFRPGFHYAEIEGEPVAVGDVGIGAMDSALGEYENLPGLGA